MLLLERGTRAVKRGNRGAETKCVSPTLQKDDPKSLQVHAMAEAFALKKKKNLKGSQCANSRRRDKPVASAPRTTRPPHFQACENAANAVKVVSRTCFGGKFCHFLHLQKGRVLVGRSSDRMAIVSHPEPLEGSVPFGRSARTKVASGGCTRNMSTFGRKKIVLRLPLSVLKFLEDDDGRL